MRSMLQLLGGVAVAGAVAAGATAFTASGVTLDAGVTADKLFMGGSLQTTVTGTVVDGVTYGYTTSSKQILNKISLSFADTNSAGAKVTLVTTGTATQPTWTCTDIAAKASDCTPASPSSFDLTTGTITDMTIKAFPA